MKLRALLLAALLMVYGCLAAAHADEKPWLAWQSQELASHPLAGKIWSREKAGFVTPEELAAALGPVRTLLLGEVHDNADHHRLQAWLLARYAQARQNDSDKTVVFEMIRADQEKALTDFLNSHNSDPASLGPAIGWNEQGWPDWKLYQPIVNAAFPGGFKISYGDVGRDEFRTVAKGGLTVLEGEKRKQLALDQPLPPQQMTDLLDELYASHCGMVPKEKLGSMADAQRFRDAFLAHRVLSSRGFRVLIAGNGHVRRSGVPRYLYAQDGGDAGAVLSVLMIEVQDGVTDPSALVPKDAEGQPDGDYFWFTPVAQRDDPCQVFKKTAPKKQ